MPAKQHALCLTTAVCFIASSMAVGAADWPQYRGPGRDGKLSGFTPPESWPESVSATWQIDVGTGDSSPALVGGQLFVHTRQGDEEVVRAIDAATGNEVWSDRYPAPTVTGPAGSHGGPRSSPTVADGKVVTLGVSNVVSCYNTEDGKLLWRKDEFPGQWLPFFSSMSPLLVDGLAITHVGGPEGGALIAYRLESGEEVWRWSGDAPGYASPVVATLGGVRQLVTLTDKYLAGIALADGKELWKTDFQGTPRSANAISPIIANNVVVISGGGRGTHAFRVVGEGDSFTAEELWANDDVSSRFVTSVLKGEVLYGMTDRGNLFAMKLSSGEVLWLDSERRGTFGALLDGGSILLALTDSSELLAFAPSAESYQELAKLPLADSSTYSHPIVDGKHIYLKSKEQLARIDL